jgi:hypothetical protein
MRLVTRVLLVMLFSGNLLGVFAQDGTTHTGFAVITLVSGTPAGLVSTETIDNQFGPGVAHAVLSPVPLTTSASILVPVGVIGDNTTAIAVANPSTGSGGVNLILTDTQGVVVLNTTFTLGPGGQITKFLNEFFTTAPAGFTTPLLLTMSSEIPVGILAFNFRAFDFAAIPLTSLATPTPVAVQPLTVQAVGTQPLVQPLAPPSPSATSPGFGLGVPPVQTPPIIVTPPVTITGTGTATLTGTAVVPVGVVGLPANATTTIPTIGGPGAFVFPQVVTGGGWTTEIAVGNTSAGTQVIRIDFFSPTGVLLNSVTNITIAPQGVFFIAADLGV